MILSDKMILAALDAEDIVIEPFVRSQLRPNSYDVKLARTLAKYTDQILDPKRACPVEYIEIPDSGRTLYPGELYLGATSEIIGSRRYVPFLDGKSSMGRLGVSVHVTAGRGDVGFVNHWTLEITVAKPIILYPQMLIAQFIFHEAGDVSVLYNKRPDSNYSESSGPRPVPSRMWKNFG